jgi:putative transposase
MPRQARDRSKTGIYHIMLRGINRQKIFHDDEDRVRFIDILRRNKREVHIKVYGWCLMENHIHLLLGEGMEDISTTMKRIGVCFAWYYNGKYKRAGHLFQDRYRSEAVETEEYLLAVVRYIHQNPVKAGLTSCSVDWQWSSCGEYYGESNSQVDLTDKEMILGIFSDDEPIAISRFKAFNELASEDVCLDEENKRMTDEEARLEIMKIVAGRGFENVKDLPKKDRKEIIKEVKRIKGVSLRQVARILGISANIVFKA